MSRLIQTEKNKEEKKKKIGLLKNTPIEFENKTTLTDIVNVEKPAKKEKKKIKKSNQQITIKIPEETKKMLNALMTITGDKFIYEIIDRTVENYVANKMTEEEKKIFKIITQTVK